jgi:signal transduction histidine kinase/ActR/RegA family two-component response regulator
MPVRPGITLSLRHLLILLTASGLLPLALLGAWSLHAAGEAQRREQERALLDQARALSSVVDAELDATVATLSSMARAPALAAGDLRAFHDIARAQAAAQPLWLGVLLTDGDGRVLLRTTAPYGGPPGSVADRASLGQVLALRRPVVGAAALGKGGRLAFPVRIPVFDGAGRLYTLNAVIRPDRIVATIGRQQLPEGSRIAVLDSTGRPVAHAGAGGLTPMPASQASGEQVATMRTPTGDAYVTAWTRLSHYGWTVAVSKPRASLVASLAAYGAAIAISLALCVAAAALLARRIAARFAGLQAQTAALGAGTVTGAPGAPAESRLQELRELGQSLESAAAQQASHEAERANLLASLEEALDSQREASRVKDEFLAVLGHELRNPLSPIAAALDLMDMRDEPSGQRERAIMRRQVRHLKRLVDDLLDVSRISSGKLQLELGPVNLAEVARESAAALPGQGIEVEAPPAVWVRGDESRLAQVLNNLLSNAVRFGSAATRVTLAVDDGRAVLAVADQGIGMEAALLARVFEPFYQAPQPLARRTGGLGLGLAIVKKIVELHGGRVAAASDGPGRGSRFEVMLPVILPLAEAPAPGTAPDLPAAGRRRRVLLVDDSEDAAAVTAALLAAWGHEVRVAHSGEAALAAFEAFTPAVAILDIGLPDMDGYALAGALRARRTPALRLVALTGYGQQADVARAARAGFDLHLTKPAAPHDLRRAVEQGATASAQ